MDLMEAAKSYGDIVVATHKENGKYLGTLSNIKRVSNVLHTAEICILANLVYPSQKTAFNDIPHERKPYAYKSLALFNLDYVGEHYTNLPIEYFDEQFYKKSLESSMVDKIKDIGLKDDPEKFYLYEHLDELRGIKKKPSNIINVNFERALNTIV